MPDETTFPNGSSRAQWAYDVLRSKFKEGRYAPGTPLREREVAAELGVSRTPAREALQRLLQVGLLESTSTGLVVRTLDYDEIVDLYAAREAVEGLVGAFAARNRQDFEVTRLWQLVEEFSNAGKADRKIWAANRKLHSALYAATRNSNIQRIAQELNDPLALVPGTTYGVPGRFEEACQEHADLVASIEARDEQAAERLAKLHVRKSFDARLSMMATDSL